MVISSLELDSQFMAAILAGLEKPRLLVLCISLPKPVPLFGGRLNSVGIGLIEILE